MSKGNRLLLVGDNPFHGISHLSDDRARERGNEISRSDFAAKLIQKSFENGADGFMFSVSETTLSALRLLRENLNTEPPLLYAIVPYAYEYVRLATHLGTIGLAKSLTKQILFKGNLQTIGAGLKCVVTLNPKDLLRAYVLYEISRIKSAVAQKFTLKSIMLHEVITEMIIALDLKWLALSFIKDVQKIGVMPGFETRNFAYLVDKFQNWGIDFGNITVTTAFNRVGFQMNPSKKVCEDALCKIPQSNVIAMNILASGYVKIPEAASYIKNLSGIKGVVVGVSKEKHAVESFQLLRKTL